MARGNLGSLRNWSDAALVERMQSILINAAEGRRNVGDDTQYDALRRQIGRRRIDTPAMVATHPSVDSFTAYIRGIPEKSARVDRVRAEFDPVLDGLQRSDDPKVSGDWTGVISPAARVAAVRNLLPLAREAVEAIIADLAEPGSNNGPIWEEREEAIDNLRELHKKLGELLSAVEAGHFEDELGQGLAAEAARYAKRAARALRDDPVPYVASSLLLGIFSACGFPGIGGYLSGVALTVQKHNQSRAA